MAATSTSLEGITVADVMHRESSRARRTRPLSRSPAKMAAHRIHCVVVRRHDADVVWGVVSDLDLVSAASLGFADGTADSAAATPAVTAHPRDGIRRAMQLMVEHQVTHVVVVDDEDRPRGVISTLDVAEALAD